MRLPQYSIKKDENKDVYLNNKIILKKIRFILFYF